MGRGEGEEAEEGEAGRVLIGGVADFCDVIWPISSYQHDVNWLVKFQEIKQPPLTRQSKLSLAILPIKGKIRLSPMSPAEMT